MGLEEAYTPELREKMARLEKENEIMRRRLDSNAPEAASPVLGESSRLVSIYRHYVIFIVVYF